jgi:hypothetical protein
MNARGSIDREEVNAFEFMVPSAENRNNRHAAREEVAMKEGLH